MLLQLLLRLLLLLLLLLLLSGEYFLHPRTNLHETLPWKGMRDSCPPGTEF